MRYKFKKVKIGALRIIKKFLWFPKCIDNEIRWLERVEYLEKAIYYNMHPVLIHKQIPINKTICYKWIPHRWVNKLRSFND